MKEMTSDCPHPNWIHVCLSSRRGSAVYFENVAPIVVIDSEKAPFSGRLGAGQLASYGCVRECRFHQAPSIHLEHAACGESSYHGPIKLRRVVLYCVAVKASLDVRKGEGADEPLIYAAPFDESERWILRSGFSAIRELKAANPQTVRFAAESFLKRTKPCIGNTIAAFWLCRFAT
jgi:hypothetical protein